MKKPRILMVIPNFGYGGAQRVFKHLYVGLSDRFEVYECVFNLDEQPVHQTNNRLVSLNVSGGGSWIQKAINFTHRIRKLKAIKKSLKIDLTISHLEGADYINILSRVNGEKLILCIHGSKEYDTAIDGFIGWIRKRLLIPLLYQQADAIVTVAGGIKNELIEKFQLKRQLLHTINNGFDIENIRWNASKPIPENMEFVFSKPTLITHGRIAVEKNHQHLLHLVASPVLFNQVHLVIIGDGAQMESLITLAHSLGLTTCVSGRLLESDKECQVFFLGYQSNPFAYLKRASLFVFPSLFEGFPLALVEAMICGVPVIARDCFYGPREILTDGNAQQDEVVWASHGVLIGREASMQSWITAISKLLSDDTLRLHYHASMKSRVEDFELTNFNSQWCTLVNRVLHEA